MKFHENSPPSRNKELVTPLNGGVCFQRVTNSIIEKQKLKDVFTYQDDVTVCGRTQEEHDSNVSKLLETFKRFNLTVTEKKSVKSARKIKVLDYEIQQSFIKPDLDRLKPLQYFSVPQNKRLLKSASGTFAYYAKMGF